MILVGSPLRRFLGILFHRSDTASDVLLQRYDMFLNILFQRLVTFWDIVFHWSDVASDILLEQSDVFRDTAV